MLTLKHCELRVAYHALVIVAAVVNVLRTRSTIGGISSNALQHSLAGDALLQHLASSKCLCPLLSPSAGKWEGMVLRTARNIVLASSHCLASNTSS